MVGAFNHFALSVHVFTVSLKSFSNDIPPNAYLVQVIGRRFGGMLVRKTAQVTFSKKISNETYVQNVSF